MFMWTDYLLNRLTEWAYDRYIIQDSTPKDQFIKAVSEMGELANAINKNNRDDIKDGIGDVIVCLNNIAYMYNTDIEDCLEVAWNSIKDRQGVMHNGVFIKSTDPQYEEILRQKQNNPL